MKTKRTKRNSGYSIIELLFYISIFAVLVLVVINAMISMSRSFKETSIQNELMQSGAIMERITRETRQAYEISSITGSSLRLNTRDLNGINKTVEFTLSGNDVQLYENSVLVGNLNTGNQVITGLTFTEITTAEGKAIKIEIALRTTKDSQNRIANFYNTVVLRGEY